MTLIAVEILVVLFSLAALLKGADLFSDFAERLAIKLKVPYFIIGVTIMAFGTSLPELFSAIMSIRQGVPELAVGDILGSNITNIFLVLGVATMFMKSKIVKIGYDLLHVDLPYFVGAAIMVTMILIDQKVTLFESLILILGLCLYIAYSVSVRKSIKDKDIKEAVIEEHSIKQFTILDVFMGILGLFALIFGAKYFVGSIIDLTTRLDISIELVALTLVPLSSNLPELIITIRNANKGNSELVVGNILGSNIFNIFGILGISSLFGSVVISGAFTFLTLLILILATILYFFITQEKQITKWEGGLLLISYLIYLSLIYGTLA
ncbi:MAG: calcium/sodium antiporter [Candidatus Dojkabacteria bacterium]|nr:calcium/sodium antiporter [Candidatus Dojkabacteria bacterium]